MFFWYGKLVADQLEDDVERRQREADHDQAALARCEDEFVVRLLQVAEELAVALGLALLGAPEHGEQFAHALARQDRLQELDDFAHVGEVDMEIRAREAEQHADRAFLEHDRVDHHATVAVAQAHDERHRPAAAVDAAHQVGAGHLVEDFLDHLDRLDRAAFLAGIDQGLHLVRDHLHAALEIAVGRAEAEIGEQFFGQQFDVAAVRVQLGLDLRMHAADRIEIEREEFDGSVDAYGAEGLARDRAEERLGELAVGQRIDDLVEPPLDARPERALVHLVAEAAAHELDAARDVLLVELDALDCVLLAAAPVALLEPLRRAARDGAELGVVVGERIDQQLGAVGDQRVTRTWAERRTGSS